jgi:hypothetical protein
VFDKLPKVNGGRWVSVPGLNTGGLLLFKPTASSPQDDPQEVEREYADASWAKYDERRKSYSRPASHRR